MRDYDFPVLDAPRSNEHGRSVVAEVLEPVDVYVEEIDDWCSMPVRLVHDQLGGWRIELGPYTLDISDINVLRAAIAAYDEAAGR